MPKNALQAVKNIIFFLLILAIAACTQTNKNVEITETPEKVLDPKIDSLDYLVKELELKNKTGWHIHDVDNEYLQKLLKTDSPATFLHRDLGKNPQIIPEEAVLGGTMFIEQFGLLTDKFAIAGFSDGHISGEMLLEFTIDTSKKVINWKVLSHSIE